MSGLRNLTEWEQSRQHLLNVSGDINATLKNFVINWDIQRIRQQVWPESIAKELRILGKTLDELAGQEKVPNRILLKIERTIINLLQDVGVDEIHATHRFAVTIEQDVDTADQRQIRRVDWNAGFCRLYENPPFHDRSIEEFDGAPTNVRVSRFDIVTEVKIEHDVDATPALPASHDVAEIDLAELIRQFRNAIEHGDREEWSQVRKAVEVHFRMRHEDSTQERTSGPDQLVERSYFEGFDRLTKAELRGIRDAVVNRLREVGDDLDVQQRAIAENIFPIARKLFPESIQSPDNVSAKSITDLFKATARSSKEAGDKPRPEKRRLIVSLIRSWRDNLGDIAYNGELATVSPAGKNGLSFRTANEEQANLGSTQFFPEVEFYYPTTY